MEEIGNIKILDADPVRWPHNMMQDTEHIKRTISNDLCRKLQIRSSWLASSGSDHSKIVSLSVRIQKDDGNWFLLRLRTLKFWSTSYQCECTIGRRPSVKLWLRPSSQENDTDNEPIFNKQRQVELNTGECIAELHPLLTTSSTVNNPGWLTSEYRV